MQDWLDAVNATDNTAAHAHASPLAVAIALKQCGVEPIMQLVCRDRNRLAMQADIVGASMHGIENICCLTGDDVTAGDEPEARRVFDLDGPQLIAARQHAGRRAATSPGRKLEPAPRLFIGAVENPGRAAGRATASQRALMKARAGARFLQLQIGYGPELLEAFVRAGRRASGSPSTRRCCRRSCLLRRRAALASWTRRSPGIGCPRPSIERVEAAADHAAACFELAVEQAAHALSLPGVAGLHLISFRKDDGIAQLCTTARPRAKQRKREASAHDSAVTV